ncbi:Vesicle transport protein [Entamoeba marina]
MQFVDEEVLLNPNTLNETSDFAVEEPFICCHLNLRNRILGFLLCFGIGGTCLISCIPLLGTFIIAPALFAFTYSIGLVLMFASMFFLYGPQAQLRKLIRSPLRLLSFLVCVLTTCITFYCIFRFRFIIVIIISLILQLVASLTYCFSLLPFSQALVEKFWKRQ